MADSFAAHRTVLPMRNDERFVFSVTENAYQDILKLRNQSLRDRAVELPAGGG